MMLGLGESNWREETLASLPTDPFGVNRGEDCAGCRSQYTRYAALSLQAGLARMLTDITTGLGSQNV
jgi:hypothetical protein